MSEGEFRSRLRRLRREGEGRGSPEEVPGSEMPRWLRSRLDADRRRKGEGEGTDPARASDRPTTTGPPSGLVGTGGPEGETAARHRLFPTDHRHGELQLDEIASADPGEFTLLTGDPLLEGIDLESAVYLDTETTGLSGGAGTYVFLIGLGSFTERGFELWQGFLREPAEEAVLLAECARRIDRGCAVVSFFGKSFDRHRLEDKMRLCGVDPPFEGVPHLDLYHPCRRLYRPSLPDGKLQTMERALCGVVREDDLPGSFAPAAWFDYLADRPHLLEAVFHHNEEDVLSLVTLASHLGRSRAETRAGGEPLRGEPLSRAVGLARSYRALGDKGSALRWLETALDHSTGDRRDLLLERADLLRLLGDRDSALDAYRELVGGKEDPHTAPALLELAKLLEHDQRDYAGAAECCELARVALERNHFGRDYARLFRDLEKRRTRVQSRLSRPDQEN